MQPARRLLKDPVPLQQPHPMGTTEVRFTDTASYAVPTLLLKSEHDTLALGKSLAHVAKAGDVITLSGPLGMGKTVIARGFVTERVGGGIDVASPTFTLANVYDSAAPPVWHFDFYRIEEPQDIDELGLDDALANGISLIEWPERAANRLPPEHLALTLSASEDNDMRAASLVPSPDWKSRIDTLMSDWNSR